MQPKQRPIELLAPAKDLRCGIAAIDHGADAVYIGAPRFSARAAAGNTIEDITALCAYAHLYGARIYVALNTLLHEEELQEAEAMIWALYRAGADAVIVQDMGITQLNLPPIPLHASTQTDLRTAEKVRFMQACGFRQVVLARELTVEEITAIHQSCPEASLEVFVHGALCVSYSGQCYISEACYKRSANRGECAQMCRLPYTLTDADGKVMAKEKHLLSLKDMNRIDQLETLLDAGVSSLKIEGRLKDIDYVKNVTAAYRQALDALFERRPEYKAASSGKCTYRFTPQLDKSFNRGFTPFLTFRKGAETAAMNSPKSLGEQMGRVKSIQGNCLITDAFKPFHNGDGLCFIDRKGTLQGFRINSVEGNKLFLHRKPTELSVGAMLYRNHDNEFEQTLEQTSAERRIAVRISLKPLAQGYALHAEDEDHHRVSLTVDYPYQPAKRSPEQTVRDVMGKLGNTPFQLQQLDMDTTRIGFIPASVLTEQRRKLIELLLRARRIAHRIPIDIHRPTTHPFPMKGETLSYLGNVMNSRAQSFYREHGVRHTDPAFELAPVTGASLMTCSYCLRRAFGDCPKEWKDKDRTVRRDSYRTPYRLTTADGKCFEAHFDCKLCQMKIIQA
jgi:putative protease